MKNKLILIILEVIIVALICVSAINGLNLTKGVRINSVKDTMALDEKYQVVLKNYEDSKTKYNEATARQENAIKEFQKSEQEFEQVKNVNSYETLVDLAAKREFNVEALWIKLGLIAENNDLIHAFNINKSNQTEGYDINVELIGSYTGIRNFIDDIMMDMDLMFKAEDITISSESASKDEKNTKGKETTTSVPTGSLTATFTIRNVNIVM